MFLNKVGSDACLVLDATYDNGTFTIAQTFTMNDLVEASKTRIIVVRGDMGGVVLNAICTAITPNTGFECMGSLNGTIVSVGFAETDGVWLGTVIV